jgi:hypothetical protein
MGGLLRLPVALRDGKTPPHSKGLGGHLQAGGGLTAFVFVHIDQADDLPDRLFEKESA